MLSKHPRSSLHFLAVFCVSKSNLSFYNFMLPCSILQPIHSPIVSLVPFLSDDPSAFQLVILLSWFSPPPSLSLSCAGSHTCLVFVITRPSRIGTPFYSPSLTIFPPTVLWCPMDVGEGWFPPKQSYHYYPNGHFFLKFAGRRVKKRAASISVWEQ